MSWKTATIIGIGIGLVLGLGAYLYLSAVERMLAREERVMTYEGLRLAKGIEWQPMCGLDSQEVCNTLDYMVNVEPYNMEY